VFLERPACSNAWPAIVAQRPASCPGLSAGLLVGFAQLGQDREVFEGGRVLFVVGAGGDVA